MEQTQDLFSQLPPELWLYVASFLLLTPHALCNYRRTCRAVHYGTTKLVTDPPPFAGYNVMNCTQDCLPAFVHWIIQGMRRLRPTWKISISYRPRDATKHYTRHTCQFVYIDASSRFITTPGKMSKHSTYRLQICRLTGELCDFSDMGTPSVFQPQRNVALDCVQHIEHSYDRALPYPVVSGITDPDTGAIRRHNLLHVLDYFTYYERHTLPKKNKNDKAGYYFLFQDKVIGNGIDLELSFDDIRKRILAFSSYKQQVIERWFDKLVL